MRAYILLKIIAAACTGSQLSPGGTSSNCYSTDLPTVAASSSELQTILQILFAIIGALAVLFIVIGGFSYVVSNGNSQAIKKAKSTIVSAIIGLIVAILAETIVTYVIGSLK